ncbi:MAG: hypothetical protein QOD07_1947 [Frankiaceae bacterium]|jgi:hypothetical protein|nr:hypothetical protein [Frankiaceae bacterium]
MKLNKKVAAGLAAGAVAVAGSGVAYAYWSSTGTGSDSSTSTATVGTVTYKSTFNAASLQPGTKVSVTWSASNSTPTSLQVSAPSVVITSDKNWSTGHSCAEFLSLDASPTGGLVPGGSVASPGTLSLGSANLSMSDPSDKDQTPCAGQQVTIALHN